MAEYYPLLAKAVGSLPNSTPESRRVVYERARKALIGQLRTMHPPVPDEDIERESVELDRAIERVETELAAESAAKPTAPELEASTLPASPAPPPRAPAKPVAPPGPIGTLGPGARKPLVPLRPPVPRSPRLQTPAAPPAIEATASDAKAAAMVDEVAETPKDVATDQNPAERNITSGEDAAADGSKVESGAGNGRVRPDPQRPIAPMPPSAKGPKRPMWILPAGIAVVVVLVGAAAWKLRVRPESMTRNVPVITEQQQADNGKVADRVGGTTSPTAETAGGPDETPKATDSQPGANPPQSPIPQSNTTETTAPPTQTAKQEATPQANNPAVPVAYRAALLVEAPDLPSKVQTFPGTVVWKLNNVNAGPSDAVGLSVEATIDLPQDKTKATVIFERNTDPSLPASHTIKVRFTVDPGSYSGDIKQISVPQMRREGNSDGEPLAGVTVPVIQNSFLVGLSPGNAETANLRLIGDLPWVDVPILLSSGKIAKLTFEKGAAGQRDIAEAQSYWQKQ